jgi:hypothetical protein
MISSTPLRQRPESLRQRNADVDGRSPLNTSFEQAVALHQLVLPSLDKFSTIAAKEKAQSRDFEQFLFSVLEETNVSSTPGKTSAKSTPQRLVRFTPTAPRQTLNSDRLELQSLPDNAGDLSSVSLDVTIADLEANVKRAKQLNAQFEMQLELALNASHL